MTRTLPLVSLAALGTLLAMPPAFAQPAPDGQWASEPNTIVIIGPRTRQVDRSTTTGAPIEQTTSRVVVSYADLDLRSQSGRDTLMARINGAARKACDEVDRASPANGTEQPAADQCLGDTLARTRPQVDDAFRLAR